MLNFWKKSLKDHIYKTKKVRINGVLFVIKKINPVDFVSGAKVMLQTYDTYKKSSGLSTDSMEKAYKKLKEHYRDVFMAGVVKPKLSRIPNDNDLIFVDDIFIDQEMAESLYQEIMNLTYGKKKIFKALQSQNA